MAADDTDDYEIGYGRPPKATRFRPGQSGNPKGRPKGVQNFKTVVQRTARREVSLVEDGRRKRVSTQEAVLLRLRQEALKGEARARDKFLGLAAQYNDDAPPAPAQASLEAVQQAILDGYAERTLARTQAQKKARTEKPAAPTKGNRRKSSKMERGPR